MTRSRFAMLLLLATFAVPSGAAQFGIRGGNYQDTEKPFGGVEMVFPMGALDVTPNVEYVFYSGYRLGTANLDLNFRMGSGRVTGWLGAGAALIYSSGDGLTDTKGGLNVLGGIGWRAGRTLPYIQVKQIYSADDARELTYGAGIRF